MNQPKFLALAVVFALSGCAIGPDYQARTLSEKAPPSFAHASTPSSVRFFEDVSAGAWWQAFGNATINAWVEQALKKSPNARIAKATLDQAAATLDNAESNLYPQVEARLSGTRQSTLKTPLYLSSDQSQAATNLYTLYNASINVSYAFDLFGGVRRGVESKQAQYEAAQWEWQGAMSTLAGNVVTAGINLASLRAQVRDSEMILALQSQQLETIKAQRRVGTVSDVELANAELSLATTRALLPTLRKQQRSVENQLSVLLGEYPNEHWSDGVDLSTLNVPTAIPLWLPSSMVKQRPDIQWAEAQLKQAYANVGLAEAAYYPQVGISGSLSSQALQAANLMKTTLWSVGASLVQTLFDGGKLSSQKKQADAGLNYAKARYEQTVLNAFGNVSNALTALEQDQLAVAAQTEALNAAEHANSLANKRYAVGTISQYEKITVERTYQQTRINYLQALATRLNNIAALYLAAGGNTDFSALGLTAEAVEAQTTAAASQPTAH